MEVLQCVLVESPEALNTIKEGHIHSIIAFLDKHGYNYKVEITNMKSVGRASSTEITAIVIYFTLFLNFVAEML